MSLNVKPRYDYGRFRIYYVEHLPKLSAHALHNVELKSTYRAAVDLFRFMCGRGGKRGPRYNSYELERWEGKAYSLYVYIKDLYGEAQSREINVETSSDYTMNSVESYLVTSPDTEGAKRCLMYPEFIDLGNGREAVRTSIHCDRKVLRDIRPKHYSKVKWNYNFDESKYEDKA